MDQQPNVSLENFAKPSKLLALFALIIAFALPFVLVKLFPHKQKANYEIDQQPLDLITTKIPLVKTPVVTEKHNIKQLKLPPPVVPSTTPPQTLKTITPPLKKTAMPVVQPSATVKARITTPKVEQTEEWKHIKTRRGDSFMNVFNRLGLSSKLLQTIIRDTRQARALSTLKPNQPLQFMIKNHILEKMIVPLTTTQYLLVYREGQHYKANINSYKITTQNHYVSAIMRGSLYNTAKHYNIPYKLIQQMTEIFAWDINFAKDVRSGDQFTIIYKTFYIEDKLIGTGDIVAVNYKNRSKVFQAVQHTDRSGHTDYFTPQGMSLKKAFSRYPLRFSHISSSFSLGRHHPILRYRRPHKGVDLAAPIGTPILATGDGRIEIIGRQSGYGNMIKIKHDKTFSTIYGHMLKFQKGLSKGLFVKRGQVIGYVGQTGLATGPHCHYEFHINRQPKNPTTVDLPRGNSIPTREMAIFKAHTNSLLAQLKLYESGHFTAPNKKNTKFS